MPSMVRTIVFALMAMKVVAETTEGRNEMQDGYPEKQGSNGKKSSNGKKDIYRLAEVKSFFEQLEDAVESLMNGGPKCEASNLASFYSEYATLLSPVDLMGQDLAIVKGRKAIKEYYHHLCSGAYIAAMGKPFTFTINQQYAKTYLDKTTAGQFGAADIDVLTVTYKDGGKKQKDVITDESLFTTLIEEVDCSEYDEYYKDNMSCKKFQVFLDHQSSPQTVTGSNSDMNSGEYSNSISNSEKYENSKGPSKYSHSYSEAP